MGILVGLGSLVVAYCRCAMASRDSDPEAQFSLLCTAMLIGTVTVQGHYFVYLVFPLTVVALRLAAMARLTGGKVFWLVFMVAAFNCVDPPDFLFLNGHLFLYLLFSYLPLYGLLALAAFFWRELGNHRIVDAPSAAKSNS